MVILQCSVNAVEVVINIYVIVNSNGDENLWHSEITQSNLGIVLKIKKQRGLGAKRILFDLQ